MGLPPGLKRFRKECEGEVVEPFVNMGDISLGLIRVTASPARAFSFLRREADGINVEVNQLRQDRGITIERARPDGGDFTPGKRSCPHRRRKRRDGDWYPDRHGQIRAGASNGGSEGWRRGRSCALPR